ncbi:anillin isoform X3 [Bombyx mori]|uniref:PH domain-containing protein n=1 Tax=Bombyx mori TaxID=7091 RepID=A0A8R2R2F4_BOMMO|nr:anillin isoform X3 [Bombyx mori]
MDPFTQRMLERARARQEKIDQKLANSGQTVPKRKPLAENLCVSKSVSAPGKSPIKPARESITSPRKSLKAETPVKSGPKRNSTQKSDQTLVTSPLRPRNDVVVTKKEFKSPRKGSLTRRNSDVSVEINISHRNDIQIEVQVEERDTPISVVYDSQADRQSSVVIKEIEEDTSKELVKKSIVMSNSKDDKSGLRHNMKSRLDRLGNLYSDKPELSSPIHRTESEFTSATPPSEFEVKSKQTKPQDGKKKFGRLAALADQINTWEDDLTHHSFQPEPNKKTANNFKSKKLEDSTLDVSIHSIKDIDKALKVTQNKKTSHYTSNKTSTKQVNECQRLKKQIVAELEPKRASTTPSATAAPAMATMVASAPPAKPTVSKKPSIKKYHAPTPPDKVLTDDECEMEKDKENNAVQENENEADDCIQTKNKPADERPGSGERGSPIVKRLAPKLNGNIDRSSVLGKAAMFEAGSPKAKEKDPAEMSLRERKALFEKNKGTAIIPKAPFGLAPSTKTLLGDNKDNKAARPTVQQTKTTPTKANITKNSRSNSKDSLAEDNVSQSSLSGGIKGKLVALFSKEQTISETSIANKFRLERERDMEMLQNRFPFKAPPPRKPEQNDSDDDQSEQDPSEKAPLMGSTTSLAHKKPEVIANIPKVTFEEKTKEQNGDVVDREGDKDAEKIVGSQPVKRRNSQDSPAVVSVLEDVKRIKVNNNKQANGHANGAVTQQPGLYPHLSDIETDNSGHEEYSDCGGSSTEDVQEKEIDKLNKSDDWAETSFGRDVMNVVKKNNTSYRKAVRQSDSESSQGACDSELDDMLDEALGEEAEGPTPPKVNKHGSMSSSSFVYQEKSKFTSPLKAQPGTPAPRHDKGSELVHSVSFYRRMQNSSSTPSTPLRVIRHASPERGVPPSSPEEPAAAVTVRQRIKELQNEITKQQTVISQASQALNLCAATIEFSGSTEQAEGERLLLLATHRRQACLHEMQRLQVEGAGPAAAAGLASLSVAALNVPLRRDYVRQLNADGAVGHHAVCLLKCRDRVLATSMQQTKPTNNTIHFPDEIKMLGLSSDFKVTVEVYLLQASKEMLPHDVKYHIFNKKSSSKLLTPKSKVSELKAPRVQSPGGPHTVRTPQFQLHGYCIFALQQASRTSFTLNKVPMGSPLEGSVCVEVRARVAVPPPAPHAAFLTAFDDVSGLGAWHRRWFRLQTPRLAYWKYPDDVHKKMPIGDIDLTTVTSERAVRASRDLCARPNTLLLECSIPPGLIVPDSGSLVYVQRGGQLLRRHLLSADTPQDRDTWIRCINQALEYVRCCSNEDDD